jgi:hypothetical protein
VNAQFSSEIRHFDGDFAELPILDPAEAPPTT